MKIMMLLQPKLTPIIFKGKRATKSNLAALSLFFQSLQH